MKNIYGQTTNNLDSNPDIQPIYALTELIEYFKSRSTSVSVAFPDASKVSAKLGHCISSSFNVTNGVRQGEVLSPQLFNVYIDGLSDILNKSTIGGSLGGKRNIETTYYMPLTFVSLVYLLLVYNNYCQFVINIVLHF